MSIALPRGYPHDLSDESIKAVMAAIRQEIENNGFNINYIMRWNPLLDLGMQEIQARSLARQADTVNQAAMTSTNIAWVAVAIALTSLTTAIGSVLATHL